MKGYNEYYCILRRVVLFPVCACVFAFVGYKPRWFRLKGNLLFYFKANELGHWDVSLYYDILVYYNALCMEC